MIFVLLFAGCQDELKKELQDPEKHNPKPEEIIPGMMTQLLTSRYFVQDYGEWWWNNGGGFGVPSYAQISIRRPHPSEDSYWSDWGDITSGLANFYPDMEASKRLNYYYTNLKNYGLLRDEIATLSGEELDDNQIFYLCGAVIKNVIGMHTVDLFNRIAFTDAFKGTLGVFFARYDQAKDVYVAALDELAELSVSIPQAHAKMSQRAKDLFAKQDIAFNGDAQKWAQYANSARLRHAVRMSGVDAEYAKKHIQDVLNKLPTEDFLWPNTQKNENSPGRGGGGAGGLYSRALYERAYATLIPNIIVQRMNYGSIDYVEGEDDPRLPVIATPVRYSRTNWQFAGCSMDYDAQYPYWPTIANPDGSAFDAGPGLTVRTFINYPDNMNTWLNSCYSQYNISTFTFGEIPSYMASRAEDDLFLAEAELKGLVSTGKSAGEHIRNSVIHSTDFWYQVNRYSVFYSSNFASVDSLKRVFSPDKPAAAKIAQFADKIKADFEAAANVEDKMEIIMQQKYIHHNILNIYELWAELRRTRHPKLERLRAKGEIFDPMPERIRYPTSEQQNNPESYAEVVDEDNFTTPVFWVPESKRGQSYYMDGYLPLKGFLPLPNPNPNRPAPNP